MATGRKRAGKFPAVGRRLPLINGGPCTECGVTTCPQWRGGPQGPKTLCNACGVRLQRQEADKVDKLEDTSAKPVAKQSEVEVAAQQQVALPGCAEAQVAPVPEVQGESGTKLVLRKRAPRLRDSNYVYEDDLNTNMPIKRRRMAKANEGCDPGEEMCWTPLTVAEDVQAAVALLAIALPVEPSASPSGQTLRILDRFADLAPKEQVHHSAAAEALRKATAERGLHFESLPLGDIVELVGSWEAAEEACAAAAFVLEAEAAAAQLLEERKAAQAAANKAAKSKEQVFRDLLLGVTGKSMKKTSGHRRQSASSSDETQGGYHRGAASDQGRF